ncbi:TPA: hypothetical protein ACOJPN_004948 [Vibrio harveyi]|uniref:hypothetical protein n=1 Tax=Vibrio harveyi TaxID=669 RepID=UPI00390A0DE6
MIELTLAVVTLASVFAVTYFFYLKDRKRNYQEAISKKDDLLTRLRASNTSPEEDKPSREDVSSEISELKELLNTNIETFTNKGKTSLTPREIDILTKLNEGDKATARAQALTSLLSPDISTVEMPDYSLVTNYFTNLDKEQLLQGHRAGLHKCDDYPFAGTPSIELGKVVESFSATYVVPLENASKPK